MACLTAQVYGSVAAPRATRGDVQLTLRACNDGQRENASHNAAGHGLAPAKLWTFKKHIAGAGQGALYLLYISVYRPVYVRRKGGGWSRSSRGKGGKQKSELVSGKCGGLVAGVVPFLHR